MVAKDDPPVRLHKIPAIRMTLGWSRSGWIDG
jgi:hypothetical protein